MSDLQLRARSVSEIVDAAFQIYRRAPLPYMLATAVAFAPWVVLQFALVGVPDQIGTFTNPGAVTPPSPREQALSTLLSFGVVIAYSVISAFLVRMSAASYLGEAEEETSAHVRAVLPKVPAILGATIVKYLLAAAGFVVAVIPMTLLISAAALGKSASAMLVVVLGSLVGVVVAGVLALYVVARYFAVVPAMVLEGLGVRAAFARSTALSRGLTKHVMKTLVLTWIIYFVLSVAVMIAAGVTGSNVVFTIATTLFTVVAYPVVGIVEMLLYYDARVRREGYDIEVLSRAPGAAPEPAVAP
jgi:hypothetical protein